MTSFIDGVLLNTKNMLYSCLSLSREKVNCIKYASILENPNVRTQNARLSPRRRAI